MCGAPTIVPVVGCRAIDRPGFIRFMTAGSRGGLKYPSPGQECQESGTSYGALHGLLQMSFPVTLPALLNMTKSGEPSADTLRPMRGLSFLS